MVQKVLVTGGCGFIGRYVTQELLSNGYQVRILDALIEQVHGDAAQATPEGVEFIHADVCNKPKVEEALDGVDMVVHLAAEVGVGQSMYEIARYVSANDLGSAVLLEAVIGKPIKRIVVASSMSVYGEGLYRDRDGNRLGQDRKHKPAPD